MAKKRKRARKVTTNQALEILLGKKAARRLRKLAVSVANDENAGKKGKSKKT